jgi:hypothetical protein
MTNILPKTLTRILNITMVYSSNTIVSNRVSMFYFNGHSLIQEQALKFAKDLGVDQFKASNGWL